MQASDWRGGHVSAWSGGSGPRRLPSGGRIDRAARIGFRFDGRPLTGYRGDTLASIEKAADAAAIVHAIVSLGRGLGMKVTAEGVETADQQLFLRAAGVHSMQGYRFGRPVSVAEISARLQSPGTFQPIEIPTALAS